MARAIYREQDDRLYKIKGKELIEIDLSSYDFGVIGIAYGHQYRSIIWPNEHAEVIPKAEFMKYYREAMQKIRSVAK